MGGRGSFCSACDWFGSVQGQIESGEPWVRRLLSTISECKPLEWVIGVIGTDWRDVPTVEMKIGWIWWLWPRRMVARFLGFDGGLFRSEHRLDRTEDSKARVVLDREDRVWAVGVHRRSLRPRVWNRVDSMSDGSRVLMGLVQRSLDSYLLYGWTASVVGSGPNV